jgi:hypothetical protein
LNSIHQINWPTAVILHHIKSVISSLLTLKNNFISRKILRFQTLKKKNSAKKSFIHVNACWFVTYVVGAHFTTFHAFCSRTDRSIMGFFNVRQYGWIKCPKSSGVVWVYLITQQLPLRSLGWMPGCHISPTAGYLALPFITRIIPLLWRRGEWWIKWFLHWQCYSSERIWSGRLQF